MVHCSFITTPIAWEVVAIWIALLVRVLLHAHYHQLDEVGIWPLVLRLKE